MNQSNKKKKYNLSLTSKKISFKNIPNSFKNTNFSKVLKNNVNNSNNDSITVPNSALFFNTSFLEDMFNPESILKEKAQSLIKLIKTYQFWSNDHFDSNPIFSEALLAFLFDEENKKLLKNIIDSDESIFLKYNIKFYKEYRERENSKYKEVNVKNISILLYKKDRFKKYFNNREHYKNNFYNDSNNKKQKIFNFIEDKTIYPLLQIIEIIVNVPENEYYDIFALFGFLNVLQFLFFHKPHIKYSSKTCSNASINGHLDCLRFLHEKVNAYWDVYTCYYAAQYGYLDCLKYTHENGCPWDEETCRISAFNGHLNCLMYAHENKCPWDEYTCRFAVQNGHLNCLQYAHENGCPWDEWVCMYAARNGHLNCLMYAHEKDCPWNNDTCSSAAQNGHLDCLMYAHEKGCSWNDSTCTNAAWKGHLDCLMYAHENGCPWDEITCGLAARYGQLKCLEYAICNGCKYDYKTYQKNIQLFIDNLECLKKKNNNRNRNRIRNI